MFQGLLMKFTNNVNSKYFKRATLSPQYGKDALRVVVLFSAKCYQIVITQSFAENELHGEFAKSI